MKTDMSLENRSCVESADAITEAVFAHVRRVLPPELHATIALRTSLYEIGLDSLTRMEILNRLEEAFKLRFSEESLYEMETCSDVVQYIRAKTDKGSALPARPTAEVAPTAEQPCQREILPQDWDVTKFPECVQFCQRLTNTAAMGLENPFFRAKERVDLQAAMIDGREVISYTSFDYLGMARHPRVIAAAKAALDRYGTSASASRLVGGNNTLLQDLDGEIACFVGTEAAVAFPSGFGTNESVLGHLFGAEDLIVYDELAHNSIVQGTRLSGAQRRPFPHNDVNYLDRLLADIRGNYRRVAVAIEGVYSMDGDYPNLPQFLATKERHHALLYVDEAHSVGVMGPTGRGICEHFGVDAAQGDLWMGTTSKALGSGGGYLAGRATLIEYLRYTTPSFVFATAMSPANAGAALEALNVIQEEPQRVARLRDRSRLFLELAGQHGLNTGGSRGTPIIPIILGDSLRCLRASADLLHRGIDVQPILYPAVAESASRLRFFLTAEHTEEQIRSTVQALAECLAT